MSALSTLVGRLRHLEVGRWVEMAPSYPRVALEFDRDEAVIVRLGTQRRGRPTLEAHDVRAVPDGGAGASIFRPNLGAPQEIAGRLKTMFEATGTKIGRVSVVLPDNLAKVTLLTLPERPPGRRQLDEIVRFRLRRAIPFRLDEAAIAWHEIPGAGPELTLLVAVMLRSVVEQYETGLESLGARPGLVEPCTLSLVNLCRGEMAEASGPGGDAILLNVARSYFTLVIVREGRLVFFRCKSFAASEEGASPDEVFLGRELASSLSYYEQKLAGQAIRAAWVRTTVLPHDGVAALLGRQGIDDVRAVDPTKVLGLPPGVRLDPGVAQRIAPCVGAAAGRAS